MSSLNLIRFKMKIFQIFDTFLQNNKEVSLLAMEGCDIIDIPENGLFLGGDIGRCIRTISMLQVVRGEEIHLLHKLRFSTYQVLYQLANNITF